MFAQDHWFLDKTSLFRTNSEDEHWDHHAVGATINLQTHASDVTKHFGSSVHIYELDNDDEWSKRMRTAAVRAGRPDTTSIPMRNQLEVGGIGTGTQTATQKVVHRIGLAGGREANYKTPVLPNSGTPALLGQRSLRKMRALIDCFTGRLYLIGPGGYQIKVSPGSETYELVESHAGHLMLPCSDFQDNSKATTETTQVMTVSDASPATANRVAVVDPWRDWDGDGSNSDGAATVDGDSDGAATVVNDFVPAAMTFSRERNALVATLHKDSCTAAPPR